MKSSMMLLWAALVLASGACATAPAPAPTPPAAAPAAGGALFVVGTIPLHGTDKQIAEALAQRGLDVELALERSAGPTQAAGKRVVVLSYSMLSTTFAAEPFADLPVPIIVLEHHLLPRLGMTSAQGHGFTPSNLTELTIVSDDPVLTAGLPPGDHVVYGQRQEMFWGAPGPGAIKVATVKGRPDQVAYFAYARDATMAGRSAPAKRVQFFHATHAPPPVDTLYLSGDGLRLLGAAIDWSLQP